MTARRISTITVILVGIIFCQGIMRGENAPSVAEEKQEYQLDYDKVVSLNASLSAGKKIELKAWQDLADDLDKKWASRYREYHARLLEKICEPLSSGSFNDKRQYGIARSLALSALDKPDMIPLILELRLVGHVGASNTNDFSRLRKEDVSVRLHAWRRLIDAIDPKWDPDEVIIGGNVAPPAGAGFPAGVEPEAIKDATLRAEYEAAIQQNRQKIERHAEQYELHKWLRRYPKRAEEYIVQAYSHPPFNLEELSQVLDVYQTDKETKVRILDAVEKSIKIRTKEDPKGVGGVIVDVSQQTTNQTAVGVQQIRRTGKTNDLGTAGNTDKP